MSRRGLMKERTATPNRQKVLSHPLLKRQCAARLRQIERQVKQLDAEIRKVICADAYLGRRASILTSIPGISDVTAFTLMVEMPQLGTLSSPRIASLAGLAPMARESGKWKGTSFIQGGRAILRHSMYMPALVATRFNPDMRAFYERLIAAGKPAKVAITAVMRKLMSWQTLWSRPTGRGNRDRHRRQFDPSPHRSCTRKRRTELPLTCFVPITGPSLKRTTALHALRRQRKAART